MIKLFQARWIEFIVLFSFAVLFSLFQLHLPAVQAALVGFSVGSLVYIALVVRTFAPLNHDDLSKKVTLFDHGHLSVMAVAWLAIFGVLGGICIFMAYGEKSSVEITVSTVAITVAWALFHFIGAIHYANVQYGGEGPDKEGLEFPCGQPGLFLDMVYFSYTVGMGFGTSDVNIVTSEMRMIVLVHAIFSFLFNLFVFAVAVAAIGSLL